MVADHAGWRTALITFYFGDDVVIGAVGVPEGTKDRFLGSTKQTSAERRERKRRDLLRFRRPGTNVCFVPAGEGPRPASAYFPSPESLGTWHPDDRLLVFMHDWEDRILGTLSLDNPLSGDRPDEDAFARLADVDRFMNVVARIAENRFWSLRLRESEETFRGIFESASDALFVCESDGRFVEVNPAACRLYGYSRAELLRMTPRDLVPPEEQHKVDLFLERVGAGEEVHLEARELRKDGSAVVVEVRGVAFQHQGHPRLLAIVRDVRRAQPADGAAPHAPEGGERGSPWPGESPTTSTTSSWASPGRWTSSGARSPRTPPRRTTSRGWRPPPRSWPT